MNVSEVKTIYQDHLLGESSLTMDAIYQRIREAARDGETAIQLHVRDRPSLSQCSAHQAEILRGKGFTVEYDEQCGWYDISGWSE